MILPWPSVPGESRLIVRPTPADRFTDDRRARFAGRAWLVVSGRGGQVGGRERDAVDLR